MSNANALQNGRRRKVKFYGLDFTNSLKANRTWEAVAHKQDGNTLKATDLAIRIDHVVKSGGGLSPVDFERILGNNDMLHVNYLERGVQAAKAVCRIFVPDDEETFEQDPAWGTGFLVGPNLLLTNHHVISSEALALQSFAEFDFELDITGRARQTKRFALRPDIAFITNPAEISAADGVILQGLDYTLIGISDVSDDGSTRLSNYGFLRLNAKKGKIREHEFVSIIQHPEGHEKQIAIRENEVLQIGDRSDEFRNNFMWYASDTAPGSSGSPVFNDNWQVVALHHSSVPETKTDEAGVVMVKLNDGTWMPKDTAERTLGDNYAYIANEGIRVSSIIEDVRKQYNSKMPGATTLVQHLVEDATGIKPFWGMPSGISIVSTKESVGGLVEVEKSKISKNKHAASFFDGREGYNAGFLGVEVALPELNKALRFGSVAKLVNSSESLLNYQHFSLEMNADRKLAFYTAVNIDGRSWDNLSRGNDKWFYDGRLDLNSQIGDELYGNEPGGNYFDRGHLVRRLDPVWGPLDVAGLANDDTFHWTNCSPQYMGFNQGKQLWQGLENHILYNTDNADVLATVFTGPIFSDNDEVHRGIPIPQYFWKVVVVADSVGKLQSAAFVVSQRKWATNIPFELKPTDDFNHFQTTVEEVQKRTGLLFSDVVQESDVRRKNPKTNKPLRSLHDVEIAKRS